MTQRRDLQALIHAAPVGKMQCRVIICCFLVVMLDGFDTAAIGFIAPDTRTHWQLSASELMPLGCWSLRLARCYAGRWRIALAASGLLSFAWRYSAH
ncbi:hypothetical protein HQS73_001437 [Salmonella enterica]|nr:hypothetical protein [Salmonella enterica]EFT7232283.1 hypothetical protein [Salmonella enterica]EFV4528964.1 hypothetical protein [Salmonella enterica]EGK1874342.1 hypothetical protein [Salmonella enterica]EGN4122551.1 hypothetical protein [Salmonella enterica]